MDLYHELKKLPIDPLKLVRSQDHFTMRLDVPELSDSDDDFSEIRAKLQHYERSSLLELVKEVSPQQLRRYKGQGKSVIIDFLTTTEEKRHRVGEAILDHEIEMEGVNILSDLSREEEENIFRSIPSLLKKEQRSRKLQIIVLLLKLLDPEEKGELIALKEQYDQARARRPIEYPDLKVWGNRYR
jgi:hypothetical protein